MNPKLERQGAWTPIKKEKEQKSEPWKSNKSSVETRERQHMSDS